MDVVLVMFKDDEQREFPLTSKKAILGRRPDCDLRIPTRDVSRRHCEIGPGEKRSELIVRDLGSSNGTFVNDKRIAETKLNPGDRLTVGPVTFVVRINGEPADIKPQHAAPKLEETEEPVVPVAANGVDTNDILDLGDIDFDFDDPTSAIEAMLDEEDEQEKEK
ncbi:MAG: FHA domain-containing protein [Planctomycetes bacterium]|nr:FHA domain-containing protein [Planctomycetota bacterium]